MDLSSRILLDSPLVLVSPGMKSRNGSRDSEEDPLKSRKHASGNATPANATPASSSAAASRITQQVGQRNEAREPEDHGHCLETEDGPFVCKLLELHGCGDEVGEGEEGPDGDED